MSESVSVVRAPALLAGPKEQELEGGRRLTYRQASSWLTRSDAVVGLRPCGMEINWLADDPRQGLVERQSP